MTGGYSEGFNMSDVMECRSKRPFLFRSSQTNTKFRESDDVASIS